MFLNVIYTGETIHPYVCVYYIDNKSTFVILYIFLTSQVLQSKFLKSKVSIFSVV